MGLCQTKQDNPTEYLLWSDGTGKISTMEKGLNKMLNVYELAKKMADACSASVMNNYISGTGVLPEPATIKAYAQIGDKMYRLVDTSVVKFGMLVEAVEEPRSYEELEAEFAAKGL